MIMRQNLHIFLKAVNRMFQERVAREFASNLKGRTSGFVIYEEAKTKGLSTFPENVSILPLRLREGMREGGEGGDESKGRIRFFSYKSSSLILREGS